MKYPDSNFDALVIRANDATDKKCFNEALSLWFLVRQSNPSYEIGYIQASRIHIKLKEFKQAEIICLQGIEKCNFPNLGLLVCHADISMCQNDYNTTLSRLEVVIKYFPRLDVGYRNTAYAYINLRRYDDAKKIVILGIKKCKNATRLFQLYTEIISKKSMTKETMCELLSIYLNILNINPNLFNESRFAANILSNLTIFDKSYNYIYNIVCDKLLKKYTTLDYKHEEQRKYVMCFFSPNVKYISYFVSIITRIPHYILDIIIDDKYKTDQDRAVLNKLGLSLYSLKYGIDQCNNYNYVICDGGVVAYDNRYDVINGNIISLQHGTDCIVANKILEKSNLVVLHSKHQCENTSILYYDTLNNENKKKVLDMYSYNKCEISYTGPYHLAEFNIKNQDKNLLRKKLIQEYNIKISHELPLCVIFEDEISNFRQILYGANKLAEFSTVIIKKWFKFKSHLKNLSNRLIIIDDRTLSPNLLRFSADFILAGFYSGTFCSSVMAGLKVIPYYTRITQQKNKSNSDFRKFTWYMSNLNFREDKIRATLLSYFKNQHDTNQFPCIYDIIHTKSIVNAIRNNNYFAWYKSNLKIIQKEVFGEYNMLESPEKTANYIMSFILNHSLKNNIFGIYIKNR